jgi:nitrogen regulatory protein PII
VKPEIVVPNYILEKAIQAVMAARTGTIADGKILVSKIDETIRI